MIGIVDYGMGNIASVKKAFEVGGFDVLVMQNPDGIDDISGLVIPGVGAFEDAMKNLSNIGFSEAIKDFVSSGRPLLGICLGYQLLFSESYENGLWKGLDIIEGSVVRFDISLKVPHIGWNRVHIKKRVALLDGIEDGGFFYFVHSYYPLPEEDVIMTTTDYEIEFASGVCKGNIYGVQFHPEKSQANGLNVIKNFGGICESNSSN